jgi:hypothetical protein
LRTPLEAYPFTRGYERIRLCTVRVSRPPATEKLAGLAKRLARRARLGRIPQAAYFSRGLRLPPGTARVASRARKSVNVGGAGPVAAAQPLRPGARSTLLLGVGSAGPASRGRGGPKEKKVPGRTPSRLSALPSRAGPRSPPSARRRPLGRDLPAAESRAQGSGSRGAHEMAEGVQDLHPLGRMFP